VGIESTNYMKIKEFCGAPRPSKSSKGTQATLIARKKQQEFREGVVLSSLSAWTGLTDTVVLLRPIGSDGRMVGPPRWCYNPAEMVVLLGRSYNSRPECCD